MPIGTTDPRRCALNLLLNTLASSTADAKVDVIAPANSALHNELNVQPFTTFFCGVPSGLRSTVPSGWYVLLVLEYWEPMKYARIGHASGGWLIRPSATIPGVVEPLGDVTITTCTWSGGEPR